MAVAREPLGMAVVVAGTEPGRRHRAGRRSAAGTGEVVNFRLFRSPFSLLLSFFFGLGFYLSIASYSREKKIRPSIYVKVELSNPTEIRNSRKSSLFTFANIYCIAY